MHALSNPGDESLMSQIKKELDSPKPDIAFIRQSLKVTGIPGKPCRS